MPSGVRDDEGGTENKGDMIILFSREQVSLVLFISMFFRCFFLMFFRVHSTNANFLVNISYWMEGSRQIGTTFCV